MGRLLRSLSSLENRIINALANPGVSGVFSYGSLTVSSWNTSSWWAVPWAFKDVFLILSHRPTKEYTKNM
eukprot:1100835-Pyramimonas_sp.AAC.1